MTEGHHDGLDHVLVLCSLLIALVADVAAYRAGSLLGVVACCVVFAAIGLYSWRREQKARRP